MKRVKLALALGVAILSATPAFAASQQCVGRVAAVGMGDGEFAVVLAPIGGVCPTAACSNRLAHAESAPQHKDIVATLLTAAASNLQVSIGYDDAGCSFTSASVYFQ